MDIVAQLLADRPNFHGSGTRNWQIDDGVLRWIQDNARPGMRTVETGAGYSSVAFIAAGCGHTAISPAAEEHRRIGEYCRSLGIATEKATFIAEVSETALPRLEAAGLDIVLIDGAHSYPVPAMDWFYTAVRLKVGGLVLVDDIHLRACRELHDFLSQEAGRWEQVSSVMGRTTVFRKLTEQVHMGWAQQPWGAAPLHIPGTRRRVWVGKAKAMFWSTFDATVGRFPKLRAALQRLYRGGATP